MAGATVYWQHLALLAGASVVIGVVFGLIDRQRGRF